MATASTLLSEDHFLCSICLDVFTEPVSVPCGHNFCQACINRHWEGKEHCQCPLCNKKFSKGLKLCVNTGFREVVDNFKKHHLIAGNNSPVKPGQVPCDCCLGNKFKASKTCLVCLTSYCETHLEPHLRVPALKRHKLSDPVQNLEDQICKTHNRMLELFCRDDQTCVCLLCTEHSAHDTVPLEKAYADKKAVTLRKKAEIQEIKPRRGKKAKRTKVAEQINRKGKAEAMANTVVINQIQAPVRWWIPHANRYGYVPDVTKGRYYLEVQPEGSTSRDSGVVRESMSGMRTFIPDPRIGNWVIRLGSHTSCKSSPKSPVHLFQIIKPERVIVFVDYDDGSVSFYDADTAILAYTFTSCNFNEVIYMFYRPSPSETHSVAQRLQETAQRIKAWAQLPDTIFVFQCIFIVFVLVVCICTVFTKHFLHFEMT